MKEFIVETYSGLLQLFIIAFTLFGLYAGYQAGFQTSILRAILFGLAAFLLAAMLSGVAFTLIRIKELLEEQSYYLQQQNRHIRKNHLD